MEIERRLLVEMLFERNELDKAERAERDLPERFEPLAHHETLTALGIDPALLMTQADNLES
ncbi:MAG: hypothetical protein H0V05_01965 [Euzebyaceae bacterium]|jgi:hypothetical protein|nr:hypothetical protein [Euzebyaceae bacterium]